MPSSALRHTSYPFRNTALAKCGDIIKNNCQFGRGDRRLRNRKSVSYSCHIRNVVLAPPLRSCNNRQRILTPIGITYRRFNVQADVIRQLGSKIEVQLMEKEQSIASMSRTDASRSRSTHTKLTRDYRQVETTFKHLLLEAKRKRSILEAQVRQEAEEEQRKQFEEGIDNDTARLQMQLKDDVSYVLWFILRLLLRCKKQ